MRGVARRSWSLLRMAFGGAVGSDVDGADATGSGVPDATIGMAAFIETASFCG
jgi:hypothetical protein